MNWKYILKKIKFALNQVQVLFLQNKRRSSYKNITQKQKVQIIIFPYS